MFTGRVRYIYSESEWLGDTGSETLRVPDIVLTRGGSVQVRVQDRAGAPCRGALVRAWYSGWKRGNIGSETLLPMDHASGYVDADGTITLTAVPVGVVRIVATAPGFARGEVTASVEVDDGASVSIGVTLSAGRQLRGRVVDAVGGGVGHAEVVADGIETKADAKGQFSFEALPPIVKLRVSADGFRSSETEVAANSSPIEVRLAVLSDQILAEVRRARVRLGEIRKLAGPARAEQLDALREEFESISRLIRELSDR